MRKKTLVLTAAATLALFACVTINIYFPAEKVESVAGQIVEEIRGPAAEEKEKPVSRSNAPRRLYAAIAGIAWADEITTVENPTIRAVKERMKNRYAQIRPAFQNGRLVEGDDGYVAVGNADGLGLKAKRDLLGLREAENRDRKTLYEEVARALNIDLTQVDRVARIFAERWKQSLR